MLDYTYDYCLFDIGKEVVRKISVAEIDDRIDTEDFSITISKVNR